MAKRRNNNSFTFYTNQNIMRVILLSMFAGIVGVALAVFFLYWL